MTTYSPVTPGRASEPEPPLPPAPGPPSGFRAVRAAGRRGLVRITSDAVAPYQSAVVRIGFALTWLVLLVREWGFRNELFGTDSAWSWTMAREWNASTRAFSVLMWNDGRLWFEVVYLAAMAAAVMLLLGWRTRTASLLFMIGVLALQNRSPFVGNGGDNVIHVMAIYLVLTRCGRVWSLDAHHATRTRDRDRRSGDRDVTGVALWALLTTVLALVTALGQLSTGWALLLWGFALGQLAWWLVRRHAPGEPRTVLAMVGNVVHAGAMFVIAAQVCLIYAASGWYKIQGSFWQDGTALYYVLHLGNVTPWPALSHAIAGSSLLVLLLTYGTVLVEVAFPFTLFNTRLRTVMVLVMVSMHAGIGILLGLPYFALAMIAADLVFLPTPLLRRLATHLTPGRRSTTAGPEGGAGAEGG